jgi:transcriptional regulator with XRE-family HTH domain
MNAKLNERLKHAMRSKNMKPTDLAIATGIPKSSISYYMSGKSIPKTDRIYLMAKALDVSEAWLLGFDVDAQREAKQKELDELAEMVQRIKKDPDFRAAALLLYRLDPDKLNAAKNFLNTFL